MKRIIALLTVFLALILCGGCKVMREVVGVDDTAERVAQQQRIEDLRKEVADLRTQQLAIPKKKEEPVVQDERVGVFLELTRLRESQLAADRASQREGVMKFLRDDPRVTLPALEEGREDGDVYTCYVGGGTIFLKMKIGPSGGGFWFYYPSDPKNRIRFKEIENRPATDPARVEWAKAFDVVEGAAPASTPTRDVLTSVLTEAHALAIARAKARAASK